jgi:ribonuclease HII
VRVSTRAKQYDDDLREKHGPVLCGSDEAGRGAWAGPLVAAAVVFTPEHYIEGLNDSKALKEATREELAELVKSNCAGWGVCEVEAASIDRKGLTWANAHAIAQACVRACEMAGVEASLYVIDQGPENGLSPMHMVPKADSLSHVVAAASVIAKTHRDALMRELAVQHPGYGLEGHKGYVAPPHVLAVKKLGRVRGLHRFSYNVLGRPSDARTDLFRKGGNT